MQMRQRSLCAGLALFAAQAAFSLAQAQTSYSLTPLGSLGGGTTAANAINSAGDIAGCSLRVINGTPTSRAFIWRNGQMTDIGSLVTDGASCAFDINDNGEVTGNSDTATGEQRAFIYTNGTITSLGNLGTSSFGTSINNAGVVAGTANGLSGGLTIGAFRYDRTQSPTQQSLGTLGGPVMSSAAINASGTIVGFASNAQFRGTTFLFQNGVLTDLGNVLGFPNSATDINDLGQIVGSTLDGGYLYVAGQVTPLPSLEGNSSSPQNINNVGQIIGSSWTAAGNHAFVITNGQIVDLNNAIVASSPDKPFVTLFDAKDINDNGWIIATGSDTRTGMQGDYLLRPVTTR